MNGPMGYGYPNQYGGPMNGMGGNMRPAYGAPNGMPVIFYTILLHQFALCNVCCRHILYFPAVCLLLACCFCLVC